MTSHNKASHAARPQRRRIEPWELLRRRGVITETEVAEWLRDGRLYVYRDKRGSR